MDTSLPPWWVLDGPDVGPGIRSLDVSLSAKTDYKQTSLMMRADAWLHSFLLSFICSFAPCLLLLSLLPSDTFLFNLSSSIFLQLLIISLQLPPSVSFCFGCRPVWPSLLSSSLTSLDLDLSVPKPEEISIWRSCLLAELDINLQTRWPAPKTQIIFGWAAVTSYGWRSFTWWENLSLEGLLCCILQV